MTVIFLSTLKLLSILANSVYHLVSYLVIFKENGKICPIIKLPPRTVSSGAEEGRTNVYVLPLTKETLLVVSISNMFENRKPKLDLGSRYAWRCVGC